MKSTTQPHLLQPGNLSDLEYAPCGHLCITEDGTILRFNEAIRRWTGLPDEELTGQNMAAITRPGTKLYFQVFIYPLLKLQGFVNEVSLDIISNNHSHTSCLMNIVTIKNDDGTAAYLNVILFPIADRKKYETEILEMKKSAEAIAAHREQLLQGQRRIMSILGHDTKAPIFSVNRLLKFAVEGRIAPGEIVTHYETMTNQLDATLILIENLLQWANASFETAKPASGPGVLRTITRNVFELLQPNATAKGLFLVTQIDPAIQVVSNSSIISFIIRNLVNNAIKFTKEGGVIVSAELRDDSAEIVVSDTGTGLTDVQISKLLAGDLASTQGTDKEPGSGMGMMLINEFITQLNGTLHIESEVGEGTTITILLPVSLFALNPSY